MAAAICPAGHDSTTTDYCDTCGAPILAAGPASGTPSAGSPSPAAEAPATLSGESTSPAEAPATPASEAPAAPEATACPSCGEPVAGRYCESCGYDVESGTPAGPPPVTLVLGTDRGHWERMVGEGEPPFPTVAATLNLELVGDRAILGRVRTGAEPDVDLALTGAAADPAISHNQCVFERVGESWTVRDAGSANGTWINDATEPLAEGARHTLGDGDRILMGAWTCLTVQYARPPAAPPAAPPAPAG